MILSVVRVSVFPCADVHLRGAQGAPVVYRPGPLAESRAFVLGFVSCLMTPPT